MEGCKLSGPLHLWSSKASKVYIWITQRQPPSFLTEKCVTEEKCLTTGTSLQCKYCLRTAYWPGSHYGWSHGGIELASDGGIPLCWSPWCPTQISRPRRAGCELGKPQSGVEPLRIPYLSGYHAPAEREVWIEDRMQANEVVEGETGKKAEGQLLSGELRAGRQGRKCQSYAGVRTAQLQHYNQLPVFMLWLINVCSLLTLFQRRPASNMVHQWEEMHKKTSLVLCS